MTRHVKAHDTAKDDTRKAASPVVISQCDGGTSWTLREARMLVANGYGVERTARVTGFPARMLQSASHEKPADRKWR